MEVHRIYGCDDPFWETDPRDHPPEDTATKESRDLRYWVQFLKWASEGFRSERVFRGQPNKNWLLTPSLHRMYSAEFHQSPSIGASKEKIDALDEVESKLYHSFEMRARAFTRDLPQTQLEIIAFGQHHGLPTRLLDWSTSPLVACYFACRNRIEGEYPPSRNSRVKKAEAKTALKSFSFPRGKEFPADAKRNLNDGVVWSWDYSSDADKIALEDMEDDIQDITKKYGQSKIFFPAYEYGNTFQQKSAFTFGPIMAHAGQFRADFWYEFKNVKRFVIPEVSKKDFLKRLHSFGISEETMFPGPSGVARTLWMERSFSLNMREAGPSDVYGERHEWDSEEE